MKKISRLFLVSLAVIAAGSSSPYALAAGNEPKDAPVKTDEKAPTIDKKADEVVHKIADFYAALKSFSGHMDADMVVEGNGKHGEVKSAIELKFLKPDKLSFVMESSRMKGIANSDGTNVFMYCSPLGAYIKQKAPTDPQDLFNKPDFAFITGGYPTISLLQAMTSKDPYEHIMDGVLGVEYLGKEKVDDVECDHLKFAQKDVTWQLWAQDGHDRWVKKVVPDMAAILSRISGAPKDSKIELSFVYKEMKAGTALSTSDFAFKPPDDAKEVASFVNPDLKHPLLNKPAPQFKLDTLGDKPFDLAEHKEKDIVVLDFWATWCPPCQRSLPILLEVTDAYKGKGVQFYAINEMEDAEKVRQFLKEKGMSLQVALDKDGEVGKLYDVNGIPQTVIVGKDGKVRVIHIGLSPNLKETLIGELDAAIAGKETTDVKQQ